MPAVLDAAFEATLITRAQAGDPDAFMALVDAHRERVYGVALRLTQNPADAEALSQDAFVNAYEHIGRFQGHARFFTWIYRITVNLCLTHLQRRGRLVAWPEPGPDGERARPEFGRDERMDGALVDQETQRNVRAALSHLQEDLRATVVLVYLENHSPREAAAVLGCAEATVHWRLFRARKLLKKIFQRQGLWS